MLRSRERAGLGIEPRSRVFLRTLTNQHQSDGRRPSLQHPPVRLALIHQDGGGIAPGAGAGDADGADAGPIIFAAGQTSDSDPTGAGNRLLDPRPA